MGNSIIIIGAGIAGLSAGCYGQMNDYETKIFEMHNKPGGICTSWKRNGYIFDGCISYLLGSGPNNNFYKIWDELGVIKETKFINKEELMRFRNSSGKEFIVYSNIDKLENHLLEIAPEDKDLIKQFTKAVKTCTGLKFPVDKASALYTALDKMKMAFSYLPYIKVYKQFGNITIGEFAKRFKNQFLRETIPMIKDLEESSMFPLIITLAALHNKAAGFPVGGSLEFAKKIEKRYIELGGQIIYESRVEKILVKNNRAIGVRLTDGTEHYADIVISAADGYTTIFKMLEGKYVDEKINSYYQEMAVFPSVAQVSLGINKDFSNNPPAVFHVLDEPAPIGGDLKKYIGIHHYSYDETLAPLNKSIVTMLVVLRNYDFWKKASEDNEIYALEKRKLYDILVNKLEADFPGISNQIEAFDITTPLSYERYTGNLRGSITGWVLTPNTFFTFMDKAIPKLNNAYMIGQWILPGGGLPLSALSGKDVIQIICHKDKKPFKPRE